ncbi:MAG: imidazole glycerol phosphate synthase subunit HisH [Longimicrobiales bacterium]
MNVSIIDYGTGNLHSLAKALQGEGATVIIESDCVAAAAADALVLPGVGAFGAAAERLTAGAPALRAALAGGLPCLGICLGMQLLYDSSEEGAGQGLGVLRGTSRRVRAPRLPQMGWNDVEPIGDDPLFDGADPIVVYYANSFVVEPADDSATIAYSTYGHDHFPAAVRRDKVWGVQFHPEKSGRTGLRLLRNFLNAVRVG